MGTTRISYSQVRLYGECAKKYEYSYIKKYKEKVRSGALFFGTAFDKATEAVLQNREVDELAVFDTAWEQQDINGKMVKLSESLQVVYAAADFDEDLLKKEDLLFLSAKCEELFGHSDWQTALSEAQVAKKQKAFKKFPIDLNRFLNLCNWVSMRRKGHLMLKVNRDKVLPLIKSVLGTQVKVELNNSDGDDLVGYVDLLCELQDGRKAIIDYKTSASDYEEDAVLSSPQLSIYSYGLSVATCGFFVFKKNIQKNRVKICESCGFNGSGARHKTCSSEASGSRCGGAWVETVSPEAQIQILINDIPERVKEIVIENVDTTNKAIKAGIFPRNFDSCQKPWGRCPYYELCFNDDDSDLEKL